MIAICFSGLDDCDVTKALDEHFSPPKNKKNVFMSLASSLAT